VVERNAPCDDTRRDGSECLQSVAPENPRLGEFTLRAVNADNVFGEEWKTNASRQRKWFKS
jgi:hypothetical protein